MWDVFPSDIHGAISSVNPSSIYGSSFGAILEKELEAILGVIWDVILDTNRYANWDAN